jgi:hypothetical protein
VSARRTRTLRAKLQRQAEYVGAVHRYWEWWIDNPVGGEIGRLDFGCSYDLADAHEQAARSVTRHLAAARWIVAREGDPS